MNTIHADEGFIAKLKARGFQGTITFDTGPTRTPFQLRQRMEGRAPKITLELSPTDEVFRAAIERCTKQAIMNSSRWTSFQSVTWLGAAGAMKEIDELFNDLRDVDQEDVIAAVPGLKGKTVVIKLGMEASEYLRAAERYVQRARWGH